MIKNTLLFFFFMAVLASCSKSHPVSLTVADLADGEQSGLWAGEDVRTYGYLHVREGEFFLQGLNRHQDIEIHLPMPQDEDFLECANHFDDRFVHVFIGGWAIDARKAVTAIIVLDGPPEDARPVGICDIAGP